MWQLAATATSEYGTGFGYDAEATAMNWYGEISLGEVVNIDWGSVPAGMQFTDDLADQPLGTTVTYISNGGYAELVKSSATWEGVTSTATLDNDGTPETANTFSLKAYNSDSEAVAVLLDTADAIVATGSLTSEDGNAEAGYYLWLCLADTFDNDTYSGTITYLIQAFALV